MVTFEKLEPFVRISIFSHFVHFIQYFTVVIWHFEIYLWEWWNIYFLWALYIKSLRQYSGLKNVENLFGKFQKKLVGLKNFCECFLKVWLKAKISSLKFKSVLKFMSLRIRVHPKCTKAHNCLGPTLHWGGN